MKLNHKFFAHWLMYEKPLPPLAVDVNMHAGRWRQACERGSAYVARQCSFVVHCQLLRVLCECGAHCLQVPHLRVVWCNYRHQPQQCHLLIVTRVCCSRNEPPPPASQPSAAAAGDEWCAYRDGYELIWNHNPSSWRCFFSVSIAHTTIVPLITMKAKTAEPLHEMSWVCVNMRGEGSVKHANTLPLSANLLCWLRFYAPYYSHC